MELKSAVRMVTEERKQAGFEVDWEADTVVRFNEAGICL